MWVVNTCQFDQILKQTRYSVALIVEVRHREDTACASLKIGRKAACCSKTRTFCAFLCQAARCARYLLVHGGFLLLVGQRCRTCTCSLTHASLWVMIAHLQQTRFRWSRHCTSAKPRCPLVPTLSFASAPLHRTPNATPSHRFAIRLSLQVLCRCFC